MAVGPIEHGTVTSVPGYGAEPFEGEAVNEADVFYVDAAFRGVKLDFRSVIRYVLLCNHDREFCDFLRGH
jgi:hypothetical protein